MAELLLYRDQSPLPQSMTELPLCFQIRSPLSQWQSCCCGFKVGHPYSNDKADLVILKSVILIPIREIRLTLVTEMMDAIWHK